MIKFVSLASGSSGNCYYLADSHSAILIDAGIGARTIRKRLKDLGLDFGSVRALLLTHDHSDHVRGAGAIGEKHFIPVYATREVFKGVERCYTMNPKCKGSAVYIEKEVPFQLGGFKITPFAVPHDSNDCVGYSIEVEGMRFCIATDVGYLTDTIIRHLTEAEYLVLESNYDDMMLQMGHYPAHLKARIKGEGGHLSNRETADFLQQHYSPQWKYVWLCHLSKENNLPELAYKEVEQRLAEIRVRVGEDLQVIPLRRTAATGIYCFGEPEQLSLDFESSPESE